MDKEASGFNTNQTVAIVGLGLIGGSYARGLRRIGADHIIAVDPDEKALNQAKQEGMVDEIYTSGNAIGVHSYTHDYKKIYVSPKAYTDELLQTEEEIYKILGVRPIISRAPGGTEGHFTKDFWTAINDIGYIEVGWNALTGDADGTGKTADKEVENIKQQLQLRPYLHRHLVILMHDAYGHGATVDALPDIIHLLKDQGYSFRVVTTAIPPSW